MPDLTDKTVLITGAARGQGRTHAQAFARAGADVVLFDICGTVDSTPYELATTHDLATTAAQVKAAGGRALQVVGDVRSSENLDNAVVQTLSVNGLEPGAGMSHYVAAKHGVLGS